MRSFAIGVWWVVILMAKCALRHRLGIACQITMRAKQAIKLKQLITEVYYASRWLTTFAVWLRSPHVKGNGSELSDV